MKDIPVYRFPAEHARENGELELYRASNKVNTACKEAIEKAISEHYCDNVLHREAVAQVAEQFGQAYFICAGDYHPAEGLGRAVLSGQQTMGKDRSRFGEPRRMGDGSELLSGGQQPQRPG